MKFLIQQIKHSLLPSGRHPRVIPFGLIRGCEMNLDFSCQSQVWFGLQERELYKYFRRLAKDIHTGVDVGANEGIYTLFFLQKTNAKSVIAFEPTENGLTALNANIELNSRRNEQRLDIIPKFVGTTATDNWTKLDDYLQMIELPVLIKVDIEGGEVDLLRGSQKLIQGGARWIIEVHSKELDMECRSILREAGYKTISVGKAWWRRLIPELRPRVYNQWLIAWSENC